MSRSSLSTGRINQKLRTRNALLQAARELMGTQGNFTLDEAAELAQVSRATAYRYFSDVNGLKIAAQLPHTKTPEELVDGLDNVVDRVISVHDYLFQISKDNESHFRGFLGAVMTQSSMNIDKDLALRGARRVPMLEKALEPIRKKMSPKEFKMLVRSLSTIVGIEAYTVLKDICKLDPKESKEAMHQLIRLALDKWT